ncbi:MAG: hypothetical protein VX899_04740 [Myxococcota bacterium]|nr:hypothetical protein [Myxococcota bacterium]
MRMTPLALALLLTACDRDRMYSENTFSDNVYQAYAECSPGEISFLTERHGIQTAFEPCGSNNFVAFAWAPDGVNLYFQLPLSAHIMNGETKEVVALPTEVPVSTPAWLSPELLVLPLKPSAGKEAPRLVLFDRVQANMNTLELRGYTNPEHLTASGDRDKVYLSAEQDGAPKLLLADFTTGEITPAFPWHSGPISDLDFEPTLGQVAIASQGSVKVYDTEGTLLYAFDDASGVDLHPGGRYIALETLGDAISPFDQRTWNELSDQSREREERRMQEWLAKQPDWVDKEVQPPVLDVFDAGTQERYRLGYVYGDRFQWYPARDYYASFVLWGLEGKELNRNVALTQLHERLRMAAKGTFSLGVEQRPYTPVPGTEVPSLAPAQGGEGSDAGGSENTGSTNTPPVNPG